MTLVWSAITTSDPWLIQAERENLDAKTVEVVFLHMPSGMIVDKIKLPANGSLANLENEINDWVETEGKQYILLYEAGKVEDTRE